jgi:hypothetical protein
MSPVFTRADSGANAPHRDCDRPAAGRESTLSAGHSRRARAVAQGVAAVSTSRIGCPMPTEISGHVAGHETSRFVVCMGVTFVSAPRRLPMHPRRSLAIASHDRVGG